MTPDSFDPNADFSLRVTPKAAAHFSKQLEQQPQLTGIRLSVKKSGCSGFKYHVEHIETIDPNDHCVEVSDTVKLYVASDAKAYLSGMEIDFVREGLNTSIVFNNPNAKDLCGCGESFSI